MYYILKDFSEKNSKKEFNCHIERFEGSLDIRWTKGKIKQKIPEPIRYIADNDIMPEDNVYNISSTILVSKKIHNIFKELNIIGIDYYFLEILFPNGKIIDNYYTANLLNILSCVDENNSMYRPMKYLDSVLEFKKLCLDYNKIPENIKIFRLDKSRTMKIIHQDIKDAFDKEGVTGFSYERLCIERKTWHIGSVLVRDE